MEPAFAAKAMVARHTQIVRQAYDDLPVEERRKFLDELTKELALLLENAQLAKAWVHDAFRR